VEARRSSTLKLKINFESEQIFGDPLVKILIDDYLTLYDGPAIDEHEFHCDIPDGKHELKIVHYGKTKHDHTIDSTGALILDKHVEIKNIEIDDIILESELWSGKFYPVYLHKKELDPVYISPNLYLGHNGAWILDFETPAGVWLIGLGRPGPELAGTIFRTNSDLVEVAKDFFRDLPDV
jgi:hypothetical protein